MKFTEVGKNKNKCKKKKGKPAIEDKKRGRFILWATLEYKLKAKKIQSYFYDSSD